ncbi:MAG: hypothetical protein IT555_03635 [Acetobacteraceae bacterium]|nr:hypothetical protein [Acetobacteraceae bacterium]
MQALKVLVAVMGVMIVAGVVTLGVVVTRRLSAVPAGLGNVTLDEPPGTRIAGAVPGGEVIVLRLEGGGPDRVAVVETRTGRVVGRIGLAK